MAWKCILIVTVVAIHVFNFVLRCGEDEAMLNLWRGLQQLIVNRRKRIQYYSGC